MKTFNCRICKENKDVSEVIKHDLTKIGTGRCKSCHNVETKMHHGRKSAERRPHQYSECDDCDRYFYKYKGNNNNYHQFYNREKPVLKSECPFCKSKNINEIQKDVA